MVFSHAIASFLYLIMAFAPSFWIAEILMICRSFLAYMDNPLRASFIVAMVRPEERGSAAGVTSLARVIPFGVSPAFAAYLMQNLSLSLPLLIAGGLQLVHDVAFYRLFRHVRPPEERLLR
jgi:sugar phosphate permease